MPRPLSSLAAGLALVALTGSGLAGQAAPTPAVLGFDAAALFNRGEGNSSSISVPLGQFRVAFAMSDRVAFEPAAGLVISSYEAFNGDDVTVTSYVAKFGLLVRAADASGASRAYLRPFAGVVGWSSEGESSSRILGGLGVGMERPFDSRLAVRYEAFYQRAGDRNTIGLSIGISFKAR